MSRRRERLPRDIATLTRDLAEARSTADKLKYERTTLEYPLRVEIRTLEERNAKLVRDLERVVSELCLFLAVARRCESITLPVANLKAIP